MAPAANTARPRRVPGSGALPADSDSDLEFQAYNRRLNEASAARTRLRKAQANRDAQRAALTEAYTNSLDTIESSIRASLGKHKTLRSALSLSHLHRLRAALDNRYAKEQLIARKLAEHRRKMLNLAVQLQALYEGRKEDLQGKLVSMKMDLGNTLGEENEKGKGMKEGSGLGKKRDRMGKVRERNGDRRVDEALVERVMGRKKGE